MSKSNSSKAILVGVLGLIFVSAMQAGTVTATIGEFDQFPVFDSSTLPATSTLDTFLFTIPADSFVTAGSISGTFGNNDIPGTTNITALSDYFVNGGAIEVAACDNLTDFCAAGTNDDSPEPWTYTFTNADLAALNTAFANGSLDFSVTQNGVGAVETGQITLNLTTATPEPGSIVLLLGGIAGLPLLRRLKRSR